MDVSESAQRPVTEVAVGIILNDLKHLLLARRPAGKPYAGYWEFPGGKLEKGETVSRALQRELYEELGIDVQDSQPWKIIEHDYPHAYVRLHVQMVVNWTGLPQGLEGQLLHWQELEALMELEPLLPATVSILALLKAQEDPS